MSKRRLRPEELDLWRQVARTTDRLDADTVFQPKAPKQAPDPPAPSKDAARQPLTPFKIGENSHKRQSQSAMPPSIGDRLQAEAVRMDRKSFTRLKRGKLSPEARIDLHGMTLDQAHGALTGFLMRAHSNGKRLVLVITGKGDRFDPHDPAPRRRGVLKQQVPMWLRLAPLSHVVLQVSEAHIRHGGTGAYYVYLRRSH